MRLNRRMLSPLSCRLSFRSGRVCPGGLSEGPYPGKSVSQSANGLADEDPIIVSDEDIVVNQVENRVMFPLSLMFQMMQILNPMGRLIQISTHGLCSQISWVRLRLILRLTMSHSTTSLPGLETHRPRLSLTQTKRQHCRGTHSRNPAYTS